MMEEGENFLINTEQGSILDVIPVYIQLIETTKKINAGARGGSLGLDRAVESSS